MSDVKPVTFPEGAVTVDWVHGFAELIVKASWQGQDALAKLVTVETVISILDSLSQHSSQQPTVVQVATR